MDKPALQLTSDNLRKLQEQYNRVMPLATEQRVVRWLQSCQMANAEPSATLSTAQSSTTSQTNLAGTGSFEDGLNQSQMAAALAVSNYNFYQGLSNTAHADSQRYMQSLQSKSAAAQLMSDMNPLVRQTSNPQLRNPGSPMNVDNTKRQLGRSGSNGLGNGSPLMPAAPKTEAERGRLCCYLKVEVGGMTQMLPIHEVCLLF